jgi:transposase-like protein
MKNKRRKFTPEFKARVALEAAKGVKTISDIASEEHLHPVQISKWKKELLTGASTVFESGASIRNTEDVAERKQAQLERKIGQLTVEVDWLRKKSKELGL